MEEKQWKPEKNQWLYYMGAKAGGIDTGEGYWKEGVVGQLDYGDNEHFSIVSIQNAGRMNAGSNRACAFRLALLHEIPGYQESNYQIF